MLKSLDNIAADANRNSGNFQDWTLDGQGNWAGFTDEGTSQTRQHNDANEITDITASPAWAEPAFDAAGNITFAPKVGQEGTGQFLTLNGWNQVVEIRENNGGQAGDLIVVFEMDPVGRRIERTADGTTLDFFFMGGQRIETRKNDDADQQEQVITGFMGPTARVYDGNVDGDYEEFGEGWMDYISDALGRVVGLVETGAGTLVELLTYKPTGEAEVRDPSSKTLRIDPCTGLARSLYDNVIQALGEWDDKAAMLYDRIKGFCNAALGRMVSAARANAALAAAQASGAASAAVPSPAAQTTPLSPEDMALQILRRNLRPQTIQAIVSALNDADSPGYFTIPEVNAIDLNESEAIAILWHIGGAYPHTVGTAKNGMPLFVAEQEVKKGNYASTQQYYQDFAAYNNIRDARRVLLEQTHPLYHVMARLTVPLAELTVTAVAAPMAVAPGCISGPINSSVASVDARAASVTMQATRWAENHAVSEQLLLRNASVAVRGTPAAGLVAESAAARTTVSRSLPSLEGNIPDPVKWMQNGGRVRFHADGSMTFRTAEGVAVRYSPTGYPDFAGAGVVRQQVQFPHKGNYTSDFTTANRLAPLGKKLPTSTWHHVEDLQTMQEIDRAIHSHFYHSGGVSIRGGN